MKRSEKILNNLQEIYHLRHDQGRQRRMLQFGLINEQCLVYIVENRDSGCLLYDQRGSGWADVIYVVIDSLNDNVPVSCNTYNCKSAARHGSIVPGCRSTVIDIT